MPRPTTTGPTVKPLRWRSPHRRGGTIADWVRQLGRHSGVYAIRTVKPVCVIRVGSSRRLSRDIIARLVADFPQVSADAIGVQVAVVTMPTPGIATVLERLTERLNPLVSEV